MPAADIAETLQRALPGVAIESWDAADQPVVVVPPGALVDAARVLRDSPELNFSLLAEMTAADYWPKDPRFEVVYHLASIGVKDWPRPGMSGTARRLRLKVRVSGAAAELPTILGIWPNADWYEREAESMFTISSATFTLGSLARVRAWAVPGERIPITATWMVSLGLFAKPFLNSGDIRAAPLKPVLRTKSRRVRDDMVFRPPEMGFSLGQRRL
jgi:NADH:ubiquinone oxidoreductase subunit C